MEPRPFLSHWVHTIRARQHQDDGAVLGAHEGLGAVEIGQWNVSLNTDQYQATGFPDGRRVKPGQFLHRNPRG